MIAVAWSTFITMAHKNDTDENFEKASQNDVAVRKQLNDLTCKVDKLQEENKAIMVTSIGGMGVAFGLGVMSAWKRN